MLLLPLLAGLASASTGLDAAPADGGPWSLVVGAGAELPVLTGAQATLEGPGRLRLGASVGRLPSILVYGAAELSASVGLLGQDEADTLDDGLGSALVLGGSVGWRPFSEAGLWLAGDLRRLRCDASASPELMATALGVELEPQATSKGGGPAGSDGVLEPYELSMRATLVGGSMGWDWVIAERVMLRFSAGGLALRSGRTVIEPGGGAGTDEQRVADDVNEDLESLFTRRFFTPTLGLGLGWRFG